MARLKWIWLPLATAAIFSTHSFSQSSSSKQSATTQTDAGKQGPPQAGEKPGSTQISAPASESTVTGDEIEALPASGRRWEDFVIGVPADAAQVNGAPADMNFGAQSSSELSVDGLSLRRAFGNAGGRSSNSTSQSSSGIGVSEPSGMGRTWSTGRGIAISEAAISQVRSSAGNEDIGVRERGSATQIQTRSGGEGLHGQAFAFNRQHVLNAQNPSATLIQQTAPATYATVPVFSQVPFTPSEFELRWGLGMGSRVPRSKIYWFAALDGYDRNNSGVATAKWAENFFAQPSNDQVQLLGAQLGTNNTDALAKYSGMLSTLNGLLGPASRTSKQYSGFGRVDFRIGERHHFNVEATGANWSAPGGGLNRLIENYGSHSFGNGNASQQWMIGRWEAFLTPNLLSVTQVSFGRSVESIHASAPSQYEQTLNQNVWGQLPQIVIDSRYGFTIGNPARFGRGSYPDERFVRMQESFDWVRGNVLIRSGASYSLNSDRTTLMRNQTGTYFYSSVANFISDALVFQNYGLSGALDKFSQHNCDPVGKPWRDTNGLLRGLGYLPCYSYYSQTMGPNDWSLGTDDWAAYVTAQWQPSKLLVLSAGLRWDLENLPPALPKLVNPDLPLAGKMPSLGSNWGPRVSLAVGRAKRYLPLLRVGYGMYFARVPNGPLMAALTQTGSANGDLNFFMRPTDNLNAGGAPPFPYVFAGEPLTIVKPGAVEFAPGFRNPEIHQAIAGIQESLPGHFALTANVMVSLGRRLPVSIETNFDPRVNPQTITYAVVDGTGKGPIKATQLTVPFYADWVLPNEPSANQGRQNINYQHIAKISSRANSTYEALMIRLVRSGRKGLSLNTRYIYGHATDWNPNESDSVSGSDVLDPADLRHEYGVSNLDARHTLFTAVILNAPWKARSTAKYFANGWRASGIGSFHSGMPYSMRTAGSVPRVVNLASRLTYTGLGPGINGSGGDNRVYGVGNDGVAYDIGRNTFRYPFAWKADVRLSKLIELGHMRQLELLGETFNLFNHRNVTEIETTGYSIGAGGLNGSFPTLTYLTGLKANTSAFGQRLNSNSTDYYRERQFQFGLRMRF